jgi:hypothetical protein
MNVVSGKLLNNGFLLKMPFNAFSVMYLKLVLASVL